MHNINMLNGTRCLLDCNLIRRLHSRLTIVRIWQPNYGPYTILKRVGQAAYQLAFPNHSKLHIVFHVSCLNKVIGTKSQNQTSLLELDEEGSICL
jgi:hypothetical protein